MTNKTYNQYCAIAHALDTVGERWSLLIVRNLLPGPKRFSDLLKGLPGISTNILTDRLKMLEEHSVVGTRFLPPPAASSVYELTERGLGLVETLTALARWGSQTLGKPHAEQALVTEGIEFMILGCFSGDSPDLHLTCHMQIQDELYERSFGIQLSPHGVLCTEGQPVAPDVTLRTDLKTLLMLSSQQQPLQSAQASQSVSLDGSPDAVQQIIRWVDG